MNQQKLLSSTWSAAAIENPLYTTARDYVVDFSFWLLNQLLNKVDVPRLSTISCGLHYMEVAQLSWTVDGLFLMSRVIFQVNAL